MTNLNEILTTYFTNEGIKNYLPLKDSRKKIKKENLLFMVRWRTLMPIISNL